MDRDDWKIVGYLVLMVLVIAVPLTLKLWSVDWDARCLITECRIVK